MVSSSNAEKISSKEKTTLLQNALFAQEPEGWRAAWKLNHLMKENDPIVLKRANEILQLLDTKKDGHQRELLKVLFHLSLNEEQEGRLVDICISFWEKEKNSPSLHITALKHLLKLSEKHPELKDEFSFLFEERYLENLSPGAKKSALRMIKENIYNKNNPK